MPLSLIVPLTLLFLLLAVAALLVGRGSRSAFTAGGVFLVAAVLTPFIGVQVAENTHDRTVTFTVRNKERVCGSGKNGSCKYLVYTDQGTFKDVDSLLNGKHNSSDVYGELTRGQRYTARVEGFRSGWLSQYPNILRATPAS